MSTTFDVHVNGHQENVTSVAAAAITTNFSNEWLFAMVASRNDFGTAPSVTGIAGGGTSWTQVGSWTWQGSLNHLELWKCKAASPLAGVVLTASFSGTAHESLISVLAFNTLASSNPVDPAGVSANTSNGPAVPSVTGFSTSNATGDVTVVECYVTPSGGSESAGSGFTETDDFLSGFFVNFRMYVQYRIFTSQQSNITVTTNGDSNQSQYQVIVFALDEVQSYPQGSATLNGVGSLTVDAQAEHVASAQLDGTGSLFADPTLPTPSSAMHGTGKMTSRANFIKDTVPSTFFGGGGMVVRANVIGPPLTTQSSVAMLIGI